MGDNVIFSISIDTSMDVVTNRFSSVSTNTYKSVGHNKEETYSLTFLEYADDINIKQYEVHQGELPEIKRKLNALFPEKDDDDDLLSSFGQLHHDREPNIFSDMDEDEGDY